ncbi:M48 family metalloprotease [Roseateles sp. LKC17W]|uniref:M48 family metalloprotease n=1 Tax=Pelomonas margarita TaxID=3299031 RepID=A0ABW7FNX6_9BURK
MTTSFATRPLLTLLAAATLALPGAPLHAQVNLPALGDSVSQDLDINTERQLGERYMRMIRVDPAYVHDPLLQEYMAGIWNPLIAAARKLGHISDEQGRLAWEHFLVEDKSINAFAMPGGFVGTHLGLIAMTVSRDELASVIGHEISHVTQRHIARRIAGDSKNNMVAIAGLLLGVLAASRGNIDMANAGIVGGQAAAAQMSLNFSRDMEREADRVGFNVLVEAGFAGSGMVSMFERMEQAYHLMDDGAYPYLRSHPLTSERIGDARTRLALEPFSRPRGLAEHALIAARARVLMDQRVDAWKVLENYDAGARNIKESGGYEQLGARYAAALASIKLRNFDRAEATLRSAEVTLQLINPSPSETAAAKRLLTYLRTELAQVRGRPMEGVAALETLRGEKSRPLLLQRVGLALAGAPGDAMLRDAADALQTHVSLEPLDALAWAQLALVWEKLGQPLRAVRAQAETRAAAGDLNGAIDRMSSGLRQSRRPDADQVEAAVIEARLRALTYERQALMGAMYPGRYIPPDARLPD